MPRQMIRSLGGTIKVLCLGVVVGGLFAGCSRQDTFPSRPITLLVPWAAGGGTDQVARQVAVQFERVLGVPVSVINATGGAGVTGHTRGAQARPDGYTITMVTSELNMLHWRGLTNITYEDYRPLMMVNRDYAAVFVRADAPWSSLAELERAIREAPGELTASGTAFGGVWHVSLVGWLLEVGLEADAVTWVSLNGAAPSLQELMAGGVDVVSVSLPEARSLLRAGAIRALGVMAEERVAGYPEVPTFIEQGVEWTSGTWRGLAVPLGVPEERFEVLARAARRVVESEGYQHFLEASGFGGAALAAEAFAAHLEEEDARYGEVFSSEAFQAVRAQRYGPWLFPSVLIVLMVLTLGALLWTGQLKLPAEARELTAGGALQAGLAVGAVLLYMVVAEGVGYVVGATLVLGLFFWQLRVKWYVAVGVIVVLVPLTYQVFAVYLRVTLPWGWLGW